MSRFTTPLVSLLFLHVRPSLSCPVLSCAHGSPTESGSLLGWPGALLGFLLGPSVWRSSSQLSGLPPLSRSRVVASQSGRFRANNQPDTEISLASTETAGQDESSEGGQSRLPEP